MNKEITWQSSVFSEQAPVLSPWPFFLSQTVGLPPSLPLTSQGLQLRPSIRPAFFRVWYHFFHSPGCCRLPLPTFHNYSPSPTTTGPGQLGVGEDPPPLPFPRPELGWGNKCLHCLAGKTGKAGCRSWSASLFRGTVFLVAGTGPTWWAEASGRGAVWRQWCQPSGTWWSKPFASCSPLELVTLLPLSWKLLTWPLRSSPGPSQAGCLYLWLPAQT